ncbi:hypothetical protein FACS1894137_05640 [Spirochaetia bacterium]|nr:hypothetical protein FACS1894137_05640 [Spirochaetia bacterium]
MVYRYTTLYAIPYNGKFIVGRTQARKEGDIKKELALSGSLTNIYDSQKYLQGQLKSGESEAKRNNSGDQVGKFVLAQALPEIARSYISSLELGRSGRLARAQGDYLGADVMETKGEGELVGGTAGSIAGGAIGLITQLLGGPGMLVGAIAAPILQQIGKYLGGSEGANLEQNLAYSKRYKDALPEMESFYQQFGGDIAGKNAGENSRAAIDWYGKATAAAKDTGHDAAYLIDAAKSRGTYGNLSGDQALSLGRQDVMWERFTGASLSNIQRLGGTALRYGGETDAVQNAYAGLQASGMGKGQFDEFLTSMQRIMEEGIENGFVRGADEIAGNMTMLSKLSGGSALWTGEQGAQRLGQMNNSIAKATDLKSIEDTMVFSVADQLMKGSNKDNIANYLGKDGVYTGTYVDTMQLMEQGMKSPTMLRDLMKSVQGIEGAGNTAGQIERYQNMFNMNYSRAAKLWKMSTKDDFMKDPESFKAEVEEIQTNPEYQSDSTVLQNILNTLTETGIKNGKLAFDKVEIEHLNDAVEQMKLIHIDLQKDKEGDDFGAANHEAVEAVASGIANRDVSLNPGGAGGQLHAAAVRMIENYATGKINKNDDNGSALSRDFLSTYQGITPEMNNDKAVMGAVQNYVEEFKKARGLFSEEGSGISSGEESKIRPILEALTAAINAFNNRNTDIHVYSD